ncbi:MAG TPA: AraC family transcriptional regulator [Verrucomicrobiae bacterium]|nr:AraC family transcriptional regulator [Verrucomicrobiae bacterium]
MPLTDDVTFRRLCRARDFLAASISDPITLDSAAREACLSPFHFQRLFARVFGETPHDFLTRRRMDLAQQLLAAGDQPVTDICLQIGYTSLGTFSSRFAARTGQSPSAFRREARRLLAPSCGWRIYRIPDCYAAFFRIPQD